MVDLIKEMKRENMKWCGGRDLKTFNIQRIIHGMEEKSVGGLAEE